MPLIACHENSTVVKQGQGRFKKRPVLLVGKRLCIWCWLDKSAVFAEMGDYCVYNILPKVEFRGRQDFLILCQDCMSDNGRYITVKNEFDNLPCSRVLMLRYFGRTPAHLCR